MTGSVAIIFGVLIVIGVIVLLIKQYETRMVLIGAGFLMAIAALKPLDAFSAFSSNMVAGGLIQNICATLGFAAVLQLTQCDKHLVFAMAKGLKHIRPLLIPAVALATFLINTALPSAAGCAAATGVVMIPLIISQGVHPATAASAVMLGTFGSMLSPGLSHNPIIAKLATTALGQEFTIMDVVKGQFWPSFACFFVGAISLTIVAIIRKENKGYVPPITEDNAQPDQSLSFKVNPLFAILPLVPIAILLICGNDDVQKAYPWTKQFLVPHAMLLGAFLCLVCTRSNPTKATKDFFNGMGKGYSDVLGIIIAAGIFVGGLESLDLIDTAIEALKSNKSIAGLAVTYGPFLLGVISGSGDAAALAFNNSVTANAADFGFSVSNMGSLAALAGSLGRTMSPLAGAAILCAGLAQVNPIEIAKRNAPGMIIASVVAMVMLLYPQWILI